MNKTPKLNERAEREVLRKDIESNFNEWNKLADAFPKSFGIDNSERDNSYSDIVYNLLTGAQLFYHPDFSKKRDSKTIALQSLSIHQALRTYFDLLKDFPEFRADEFKDKSVLFKRIPELGLDKLVDIDFLKEKSESLKKVYIFAAEKLLRNSSPSAFP